MRSIVLYVLFLACTGMFFSCEDVIDVDLNDSEPQLVIEADINNMYHIQNVFITRTLPFSDERKRNPVSGADVNIIDNTGIVYIFEETAPGTYRYLVESSVGQDVFPPGRIYELFVDLDGKRYHAASVMPAPVLVDSVTTSWGDFLGVSRKALHAHFQDPDDVRNFCRYTIAVNSGLPQNIAVFDDKFNNGRYVTHDLFSLDMELETGDEVEVTRYDIDEKVHRYWYALNSLNPGSASPANPPSNISNGALGYFSASYISVFRVRIGEPVVNPNKIRP